jgi:hypothetical protein
MYCCVQKKEAVHVCVYVWHSFYNHGVKYYGNVCHQWLVIVAMQICEEAATLVPFSSGSFIFVGWCVFKMYEL